MSKLYQTLICFTFSLAGLILAAMPAAAQPAEAGQIVFVAFKDGQWDIFSVSATGADLRQLTHDSYEDDAPAYSPDGTHLAYASRREENWDLYLLDLRTGQEVRLTSHPHYDGAPAWHPQGDQIAFESFQGGDLDIWLLQLSAEDGVAATGPARNLTADSAAGEFAPTWHDDGQTLFFSSWQAGNADIWSLNLAESSLEQITSGPASDSRPVWRSIDGQLAFSRDLLGDKDVFFLDADTAQVEQWSWLGSLTGQAGQQGHPADSSALVGVYRHYDGAQLVRLAADNPIPQPLTERTMLREALSWHADPVLFGRPISTLLGHNKAALYAEVVRPSSSPHGEPYDLIRINSLKTGTPWLADTIDDSYRALRHRLLAETGYDFLGEVSETLRPINYFSQASQYSSWHKSGRAVDTLFDLPGGRLQIVRQNIGGETYWRLLLRCQDQSGRCGRPATVRPWDYSFRARTVIAPEQGGIEGTHLFGYYLDFTTLAEIYGWERIASYDDEDFSWTWHFKAFEYWHYQNTNTDENGHTNWYQAMLEVYPRFEVEEYFTWDLMRAADEDPYLIAMKGAPLPPHAERWWQTLTAH